MEDVREPQEQQAQEENDNMGDEREAAEEMAPQAEAQDMEEDREAMETGGGAQEGQGIVRKKVE